MTQAAPGWYPSPDGAPAHVWWDGQQWTAHTAPMATPHEQAMLAATQATARATRRIRWMIACLILSVVLIVWGAHLSGR